MKKCLVFLLAVLLSVVMFAGETPKKGGTFIIAHWGDPISFNPDAKVDDAGNGIYGCIFSKLITLDADYNVIPDLAESWEVSEDGLTYTFHLRKGVKWHDGHPFTSADVAWTLNQIRTHKEAPAWKNLVDVEDIETPDDYTVIIKLSKPYAPFLGFLAWYGTWIMPQHLYAITENGSPVDWLSNPHNQNPVGTGPFKFAEWVKGDHVTVEKNPDYFLGEPYVDKIVFKILPDENTALQAFLNGEVDYDGNVSNAQISILKRVPGVVVKMKPAPSRYYIAFNIGGRDMATVIKEQLDKVGIKVKLEEYEIAAYIEKVLKAKDFDITELDGFQGPDPDNLKLRVGSDGDINVMGYSNEEVDALLQKAGELSDIKERAKYYFKVQEILSQDLPIYVIGEVASRNVHKDYVKGLPYELTGVVGYNNYAKVWLDK